MLNARLTRNQERDVIDYAATFAATEISETGCCIADAVQRAVQSAEQFRTIWGKLTICPGQERDGAYWIWKCPHCGGWHASIHLPEGGECYGGITREQRESAGEHIANAKRKGSRSACWNEAEKAADLLGVECPADKAGRWPDLAALEALI